VPRANVPTMTDARREEARRLRLDPGLSRAELIKHFGVGNGTLTEWLRGIEPPAWTRRPNAKDELRGRAVDLRRDGCSVPEIASRLGVSKSTAYLWTRHLPLDPTPAAAAERRRRHMEQMQEARWQPHRLARDAKRATANEAEAAGVGQLSDREINLIGAVMYWCEGQKAKPWEPNRCRVVFINSDPLLIRLFLRFVDLLGADRSELTYRITIHESADVEATAARRSRSTTRPPFGTTSGSRTVAVLWLRCRSRVRSTGGLKASSGASASRAGRMETLGCEPRR
jgi:transposase